MDDLRLKPTCFLNVGRRQNPHSSKWLSSLTNHMAEVWKLNTGLLLGSVCHKEMSINKCSLSIYGSDRSDSHIYVDFIREGTKTDFRHVFLQMDNTAKNLLICRLM